MKESKGADVGVEPSACLVPRINLVSVALDLILVVLVTFLPLAFVVILHGSLQGKLFLFKLLHGKVFLIQRKLVLAIDVHVGAVTQLSREAVVGYMIGRALEIETIGFFLVGHLIRVCMVVNAFVNSLDSVVIELLLLPYQEELILEFLCEGWILFHQDIKLSLLTHFFASICGDICVCLSFYLFARLSFNLVTPAIA